MFVIPMAGLSSRFFKAGYTIPKYQLDMNGKTVFQRSLDSFSAYYDTDTFVIILRDVYETKAFVENELKKMGVKDYHIVVLNEETAGQAETVYLGVKDIPNIDNEPMYIFNIDTFRYNFKKPNIAEKCDGYLEVFQGEGEHWSFVEAGDGDKVIRTTEKERISDLCSDGLYYFKNTSEFKALFKVVKAKNLTTKGELYIAPMYNLMIAEGKDIRYVLIKDNEIDFCGTPDEYEALKASGLKIEVDKTNTNLKNSGNYFKKLRFENGSKAEEGTMNALMIPIHPPKINWLYMFLKSINPQDLENAQFEFVLLISNAFEKIHLINGLKAIAPDYIPFIKFVDIDLYIGNVLRNNELLDRFRHNTFGCIVNVKKFCGLHWAKDKYNYIAVIDCDTFVINSTLLSRIFPQMIENYNKNLYFGAVVEDEGLGQIIYRCTEFFPQEKTLTLAEITKNYKVYTWFFDVPFYKGKDLEDFFNFMLFREDELKIDFWLEQNWHSFEHLIFVFYRCLYKNAQIIDYSTDSNLREPEALNLPDIFYLQYKYDYMPVWFKFSTIIHPDIHLLQNEPIYLLYHTDRI